MSTTTTSFYSIPQNFFVTFVDLVGPLPLMTSPTPTVSISKYRAGDAPYRRAVQVTPPPPPPPVVHTSYPPPPPTHTHTYTY